jgi:flagellar capping protein FliD
MSTSGQMSFDELTFAGAALGDSAMVNAFLGSATGGGFLETATNALNNLLEPGTGLLTTEQSNDQTQITNLQNQITSDQANVSAMQSSLQNQLAQSDATIAELEQQYSSLTQMFAAENTANLQIANGV